MSDTIKTAPPSNEADMQTIRVVNVRGMRTPEQRAGVCYVGRKFAGWPASQWGNPFKVSWEVPVAACLTMFLNYAKAQSSDWLADLWEACEHGEKPLGCWCINATNGDGQPIVCHAQILAAELHKRFMEAANG